MRRSHLATVATAGALVLIPAACGGGGDKQVFSAATAVSTSAVTTSLVDSIPVTTLVSGSGAAVAASLEMSLTFRYTASDAVRVRNPYIAVWIEDTEGRLVKTLNVWYEQTRRGANYLRHLRSWYEQFYASQQELTVSSPTRAPGEYSLVWDGTDDAGNRVVQGDYVLFVESAREHGPYSATSATISLGTAAVQTTLADDGELSALSASVTV